MTFWHLAILRPHEIERVSASTSITVTGIDDEGGCKVCFAASDTKPLINGFVYRSIGRPAESDGGFERI